jgi:hypothetical protein
VLAARSSVFMAELFGSMKEKTTTWCIAIHGMEARVFEVMLHFIYTDSLLENGEDETCEMAQHLLVAADRYNLERLKMSARRSCADISTRARWALGAFVCLEAPWLVWGRKKNPVWLLDLIHVVVRFLKQSRARSWRNVWIGRF